MIRVTVWNEYIHEREYEGIRQIYPEGIHGCIRSFLETNDDIQVRVATLDMPEHGLAKEVLEKTDVLIWWGHCAHEQVEDAIVERIKSRVLQGMGLIALHSAHHAKVMKALLGTSLNLKWCHGVSERLHLTAPGHPIAAGVDDMVFLDEEEMYGEFFDIPKPDDIVFLGWFSNGYAFRSGVTFTRGRGKIFYFQPGHESYPIYRHPQIQKIITNAVRWAAPVNPLKEAYPCTKVESDI